MSVANTLLAALWPLLMRVFGLLFMAYYFILTVVTGRFFEKPTTEYKSELALARDYFWDLSKQPFDLHHRFLSLRGGFRLHYVTNTIPDAQTPASKPLVIFVHGFPDSWAVWRHILGSTLLRQSSNLVAIDLPGYGGSDLLKHYSATEVLETLTEGIVALREKYAIDSPTGSESQQRVFIVAHDWGCTLGMRLAAEAPQLADRFIFTNGPLVSLVRSNIGRLSSSSLKMLKVFYNAPVRSRPMLSKALHTVKPVLRQFLASGYVFALQLPTPILYLQGSASNGALLRMIHGLAQGSTGKPSVKDIAEGMASGLGPAPKHADTETADLERYSQVVAKQRASEKYVSMTNYYRHSISTGRWEKSLETIAALYSLSRESEIKRNSSHAGVFDEGPEGSLKARATIVWGANDPALDYQLNLDGISDYLVRNSQVVVLPVARHHTIVEKQSRLAIQKAVEWAVAGEKGDVGSVVKTQYPTAVVTVRT